MSTLRLNAVENLKKLHLTNKQLRMLQDELLILLKEFDRICKKHNIPYFLHAGTLLGAVRHQGFIPWDDDIDVSMLREDYNRFREVVKEELDTSKYFYQSQETDEHYNWVFARLRLQNTVYKRVGQEHLKYHDGIFMDIFPLDDISENKIKQNLTLNLCKVCKKALWAPIGVKYGKNIIHKLVFKALSLIPRNLIIRAYEFLAIHFNRKETSLIASHNVYSVVLKKEWYEKSVELEFEGFKFKAPHKYHNFLEVLYGDYMKLPPKEERMGHHYVSYIKFTNGQEVK